MKYSYKTVITFLACASLALAACSTSLNAGKGSVPSVTPALTPTPTASGTLPTPAPVSGIPTAAQAWGDHAASASFSNALDSTHVFQPQVISRDGTAICGLDLAINSQGQPTSGQIGLLTVASRHFQAMPYPNPQNFPGYPPGCDGTDGRYFLVRDSDAPGATGGVLHVRYWSYDTQTGQMRVVATAKMLGMIQGIAIDHGSLAIGIESPQGNSSVIDLIDLSTGAVHTTKSATGTSGSFFVKAFSWPDVIYDVAPFTNPSSSASYTLNLQTNAQTTLPSLTGDSKTITGDTLFAVDSHTTAPGTAEIDEIDHVGTSGAQTIHLFAYPDNGGISAADSRLIVFVSGNFPLVWDRAEHHLVLLANPGDLYQGDGIGYPVQMSGDFLMITTKSGNHGQVAIYDAASLPVQ